MPATKHPAIPVRRKVWQRKDDKRQAVVLKAIPNSYVTVTSIDPVIGDEMSYPWSLFMDKWEPAK